VQSPAVKQKHDDTVTDDRTDTSLKRKRATKEDTSSETNGEAPPPRKRAPRILGGKHPCPYAKQYGCTKTFKRTQYAIEHGKSHTRIQPDPKPCPYAELYSCGETFRNAFGAKNHKTIHRTATGQFPCPYAELYACSDTFLSAHSAESHRKKHEGTIDLLPCPYAELYGSTETFVSITAVSEHRRAHRHPCSYAELYSCPDTFVSIKAASEHKKDHMTVTGQFPCPYSELYNCSDVFASLAGVKTHKTTHTRTADDRVPCPHSEKHNCHKRFVTIVSAAQHGKTCIPLGTVFPCPCAETHNCSRKFERRGSAMLHANKIHWKKSTPMGPTKMPASSAVYGTGPDFQLPAPSVSPDSTQLEHFEAPISEEKDIEVVVASTISTADTKRIPCPHAEAHSCPRTFRGKWDAQKHGKVCTLLGYRFPCPYAETCNCPRTFKNRIGATRHGNFHNRPSEVYICSVHMCKLAVSGQALNRDSIEVHMKLHKSRGDLDDLATYPNPVKIPAPGRELARGIVDAGHGMIENEELAEFNELAELDELAELEELAEQEMANDESVDEAEILQWLTKKNELSQGKISADVRSREEVVAINETFRSMNLNLGTPHHIHTNFFQVCGPEQDLRWRTKASIV